MSRIDRRTALKGLGALSTTPLWAGCGCDARPSRPLSDKRDGRRKPETFDFLGFTHIEGRTRAGKPTLLRRTSRKKRTTKLAALRTEIRKRRHRPVHEQQRWLSSVLRGHYQYYGVPHNYRALASFFYAVESQWHRSLQRRSQRGRWTIEERERFRRRRPLPMPSIRHPWPSQRFALR
jgi:RNA-directed DNA polymerase